MQANHSMIRTCIGLDIYGTGVFLHICAFVFARLWLFYFATCSNIYRCYLDILTQKTPHCLINMAMRRICYLSSLLRQADA